MDYGSSFGSCTFRWWFSRCQQKIMCFFQAYKLITFCRCIYISLKDYKELTSHKTGENQGFSYFCFLLAQYLLDREHCFPACYLFMLNPLHLSPCKSGMAAGWILRHLCSLLGTLCSFFLLFYVVRTLLWMCTISTYSFYREY
jgi:hypothetical protein